ncbi:MAG: Thivi_2564 family membrane protein, partial [Candidatus Sulfotelmatobacter sp.]
MSMQAVTVGSERRISNATAPGCQVSYLAQTRKYTPVILYSPECVDGAADADSQLLIHRLLQRPHPANRHSLSDASTANLRRMRFDPKSSRILKPRATPRADERGCPQDEERSKIMPLIQLLEVLIVVGVLLWLVNRFIPMQSSIKS